MQPSQSDKHVPVHVAIIMDGNGRWAEEQGLPRHAGHQAGVGSVRSTVEQCLKHGVAALTLFAFSSENWRRPAQEVGLLMDLFLTALQREAKRLQRNNVRLRVIGDRSAFSAKLQDGIAAAESLTAGNDALLLQIAANYGGRWDVAQAARRLAQQVADGRMRPEEVNEVALADALSFPDIPDPDLYIRTGGERRLSNFLLWQAAYSELYFTATLWPDFDAAAFDQALEDFARRQRRFGMIGEQVQPVKA
jgi:undecaprenyl diphosphate synthase